MLPAPPRSPWTPLLRTDALAWSVLGATMLVTGFGWRSAAREEAQVAQQRFALESRSIEESITRRMHDYEQALRGGVALFDALGDVPRDAWRRDAARSDLQEAYPGIRGFGYAVLVPPAERAALVAQVRAEGFPEFRVWPEGGGDVVTSIVYLEPLDAQNRRAFGYDMWSEPVRREAMARARDPGQSALSGRVTLKQEAERAPHPGVLLYLPVYAHGRPSDTAEARRAALRGWVYAPFRMRDLMRGILGARTGEVDVEVYDATVRGDVPLYQRPTNEVQSGTPSRTERRTLSLAGRRWVIVLSSTPAFDRAVRRNLATMNALASVGVNLLVFGFLLVLGRQHRAAQRLTGELEELSSSLERRVDLRTSDLEESRARLQQTACIDALIAEVAEQTSREQDLDHALQGCADALVARLDATLARIWLIDEAKEVLGLHASAGLSRRVDGTHARIPLGNLKIGRIAQSRAPHVTNAVMGDPLVHDQAWARREGLVAFAGYPLLVGDELMGVVAMFARRSLSTEGMDGLGRVAQVLALGIARSRAHARLQRANEQLQASLHEHARVAWLITHNLRTPLRAIHARARGLQDEPTQPERVQENALAIARDVKRFAAQLDDLVRFTTLYQAEIPDTPVDLRACAEAALAEVRPAYDHGARVRVDIEPLPSCRGSAPLLQELLRNLLANAFSFTRTVQVPEVTVTGELEVARVDAAGDLAPVHGGLVAHLQVHDNGIGFDMRFHDRIFELFQRLNRREDYPGTGCGLALARRIVERHDGAIWAESVPGAGATFHVWLPA